MYLKAIELHGFKSFPDKTRISFDKGMTAVIGPNGSGKSNISDAIRWVLGETSGKELRSAGKMEDIIFGGTSQRGPMGFASVSLILDNADRSFDMDSDEVSVTRKYYRGGEGEYFINGNRVRLKDIYELFLDTGLGKSGYSIVGQGKISQIVTAKPENRREIFEEASGISKFRYRKNEAEKKLAGAQDNIVRLTDNLLNLEERVEPLEKESKKAREFLKLDQQKKGMEISLWLHTVEKNKALIREQQRRIEVLESDYSNVDAQIKEKEAYIDKRYFESSELVRKGEENNENIRSIEQNIGDIKGQISAQESGIVYDDEKIKEFNRELKLFSQQSDEAESEKERLLQQYNAIKADISSLEAEEKQGQEELLQLAEKAKETDSRKGQLMEEEAQLLKTVQDGKTELYGIETQNASVAQTKAKAETDLAAAKEYLEQAQQQLNEVKAFEEEVQLKITQNTNIKNGIGLKLRSVNEKLEKAKEELNQNSQKQFEANNRIRVLTEMENSLEGFQNSVKVILNNGKSGRLKGVIGTVAQLITVEKGYETAIETALGYGLQNIVMENESCTKYAMEFLKNSREGRATFLPLDTVKPSSFSEKLPEWATTAERIVTADPKYSHIISNMMSRLIICEDINAASRLAKQLNYRYKIVTKDGQQINAGGSFTGGSTSKSAGLFTRKGKIEELKASLAQLKQQQAQLEKTQAEIKESYDLLNSQIEGCDAEIEIYRKDENNCNIEKARCEQLVNQYKDSIYLYEGIVENSCSVVKANEEKQLQLEQLVAQGEKQLEELAQQLSSIGESDNEYSNQSQKIRDNLHKISLGIIAAKGELNVVQVNMDQLEKQSQQDEKRREYILQEIEAVKQRIEQKTQSIAQMKQQTQALAEQIKAIEEENKSFVALRMEIEKERTELSKDINGMRKQYEELSNHIIKAREKVINMEMGYDDIIQKLWEEYELTVQTAKEFAFDFDDEAQLRKDLAAVKSAIKRLGNVNVNSIDEYREVYEKYNFLKEQLKDLEESKQQLQKLITSLNGEMKTLFKDSFDVINTNFGRIFRELFGGGSAKLILTEPDNILESGVDISVNPPGKVIKSLTALSGGEQALVAISIYFAILAHNPSPFCILDEIEAALDDANVTRYANYLHNISDTTQFIVITHRRGTMESADVLYGVTMQNDGISKLLKLDVNNISPSLIN